MTVKWNGSISEPRDLPGGGPQGSWFGGLEFDVNSNSNADHVEPDMRFKFVDDMSLLELINLLAIGLIQYDVKSHVPSDVKVGSMFLPSSNCKSQSILDEVAEWTDSKKMMLNEDKSK